MKLREYLRTKTNVYELCVIRENGWIVASCWIDHEDLFHVPERLADKEVKKEEWDYLTIVNENNAKLKVPCHYVYV